MQDIQFIEAEKPRLKALARKVAKVHGSRHPELPELAVTVDRLFQLLDENPEVLQKKNIELDQIFGTIRTLTSGFVTPPDACNSYLSFFYGLERFELNLRAHIQRRNDIPIAVVPSATAKADMPEVRPHTCCDA